TRAVFLEWSEAWVRSGASWLAPGILEGISLLDAAGYRFFVVSPDADRELESRLGDAFGAIGVPRPAFFGQIEHAVAQNGIRREQSWVIGADPARIEASRRAGSRAILVGPSGVGSFQIAALRIISGLDQYEDAC